MMNVGDQLLQSKILYTRLLLFSCCFQCVDESVLVILQKAEMIDIASGYRMAD